MAKFNHFASENIGMSFLGHLVVLGIIVFVTDIVISDTERFVAPDRIQITMIDLNQVKVSGDETILYNTNTPDEPDKIQTQNQEPEPTTKPTSVNDEPQQIETTSLIEEEKTKQEPKKEEPKKEEK